MVRMDLIYFARNEAFPSLIKIGRTDRDIQANMDELSADADSRSYLMKDRIVHLSKSTFNLIRNNSASEIKRKIDARLTDLAIEKAKVEVAKRGLNTADLSEDQLELIVRDEKDKLISQTKDKSLGAILLILGIQVI